LPCPPFALTEVPGHGNVVIWVISFRPWTEAGQVPGCFPQAVHPDRKREARPCPLSSRGVRALERQAVGTLPHCPFCLGPVSLRTAWAWSRRGAL